MRLTKSQLKQIIQEELSDIDQQEYEEMYAPNEATELLKLYNNFVSQLQVGASTNLMELDTQIRDKIEQIEIMLNEMAK